MTRSRKNIAKADDPDVVILRRSERNLVEDRTDTDFLDIVIKIGKGKAHKKISRETNIKAFQNSFDQPSDKVGQKEARLQDFDFQIREALKNLLNLRHCP